MSQDRVKPLGASKAAQDKMYAIGRAAECDIQLSDPSVSRVHADVQWLADGRLLIVDRDSTNGTFFYDGEQWRAFVRATVQPTARLRFGDCEVVASEIVVPQAPASQRWLWGVAAAVCLMLVGAGGYWALRPAAERTPAAQYADPPLAQWTPGAETSTSAGWDAVQAPSTVSGSVDGMVGTSDRADLPALSALLRAATGDGTVANMDSAERNALTGWLEVVLGTRELSSLDRSERQAIYNVLRSVLGDDVVAQLDEDDVQALSTLLGVSMGVRSPTSLSMTELRTLASLMNRHAHLADRYMDQLQALYPGSKLDELMQGAGQTVVDVVTGDKKLPDAEKVKSTLTDVMRKVDAAW